MRTIHGAGAAAVCLLTGAVLGQAGPSTNTSAATGQAPATQAATPAHREWAAAMTVAGLPNLHQVTPNLYRCAQPTREGMQHLKDMKIKTVISLRSFHDDDEELEGAEGVRHFQIYMKAWHAEKEDAVKFLKLVTDPANQPVLVHCQHGADRTGTMCAVYRMAVQGWTKEQAIQEMTDGGFGFHEVWANLKSWLDTVDVQELRHEAGIR